MPTPLPHHPPVVTLLTDFGTADAYVAEMKAAVLRACPMATLVDITHEISPQNVLAGALALERAVSAFSPGTVHVAVIDPGVGTDRRLLAVRAKGQTILVPDNGLITWLVRRCEGVKFYRMTWWPTTRVSATFHGRDVLAPAAGLMAAGAFEEAYLQPVKDAVLLDVSPATSLSEAVVIGIDRFGNVLTNVSADLLHAGVSIWNVGPVRRTYADVDVGRPLALVGSGGLLEIAVRDGSAANELGYKVGDKVIVR